MLTGSANFSTSAQLGDQHEVLICFRDDRAWEHFERQYLEVRDHASADVPIATLAEQRLDPDGGVPRQCVISGRGSSLSSVVSTFIRRQVCGLWCSHPTLFGERHHVAVTDQGSSEGLFVRLR